MVLFLKGFLTPYLLVIQLNFIATVRDDEPESVIACGEFIADIQHITNSYEL